jgi:dTDP-4-dehydrorhamnose 3,5-epimerase-like enzyme
VTVPVRRIPLRRFEDDRGWFTELMRASLLPKPVRQSNLVFSRKGVVRGLHYHELGQDDLFLCGQGMVRVVVLDVHRGHRRRQSGRDLHPRHARARV